MEREAKLYARDVILLDVIRYSIGQTTTKQLFSAERIGLLVRIWKLVPKLVLTRMCLNEAKIERTLLTTKKGFHRGPTEKLTVEVSPKRLISLWTVLFVLIF